MVLLKKKRISPYSIYASSYKFDCWMFTGVLCSCREKKKTTWMLFARWFYGCLLTMIIPRERERKTVFLSCMNPIVIHHRWVRAFLLLRRNDWQYIKCQTRLGWTLKCMRVWRYNIHQKLIGGITNFKSSPSSWSVKKKN